MTLTLTLSALVVAGVAAARSTWSPCGLSMLSTITPPAERAKGHRYGVTCAWFVLGAAVGGLALGGLAAVLALAIGASGATPVALGSVGLAAAAVALVSDRGLAGVAVPMHCRQVNERWLDAYRPWVYGVGFGFQIGSGLATYITTSAVYLVVVLAALTGDPLVALAVGGAFGLLRGLAVTLTRRVSSPTELLAFHRRFAALQPRAQLVVEAALALVTVVLAVAVGPSAVAVLAPVALLTVAGRAVVRSRRDHAGGAMPAEARDRGSSVPVG